MEEEFLFTKEEGPNICDRTANDCIEIIVNNMKKLGVGVDKTVNKKRIIHEHEVSKQRTSK
jgi:hypothetical protein